MKNTNDDLNDEEKALLKAIEYRKRSTKKWDDKISKLRAEIKAKCRHIRTVDFKWESDDGYGHWWRGVGKECAFCEKQNKHPTMSDCWNDRY